MVPFSRHVVGVTVLSITALSGATAQVLSRVVAGGSIAASDGSWQPQVALRGDLVSPDMRGLRGSVYASFARSARTDDAIFRSELVGGARLSALLGTGGVWFGADALRRRDFSDVVEQPRLTSGAWRRIGGWVVALTASRRSVRSTSMEYVTRSIAQPPIIHDSLGKIDTILVPPQLVRDSARRVALNRWSETEATLFWEGRRVTGSVAVGGRIASRGIAGGVWTSGDLAIALARPIWLVLGASVSPGAGRAARVFPASEHRYVTLGFRVAPRFFRGPTLPAPTAALPTAFIFDDVGGGSYRFTLHVPRARRVQLSGDFTGWKPVSLTRGADDRWMVTLPVAFGTHRLNIRIDDGPWIAPPGMTTMSDDYAGEVGLLVIDGTRGPGRDSK